MTPSTFPSRLQIPLMLQLSLWSPMIKGPPGFSHSKSVHKSPSYLFLGQSLAFAVHYSLSPTRYKDKFERTLITKWKGEKNLWKLNSGCPIRNFTLEKWGLIHTQTLVHTHSIMSFTSFRKQFSGVWETNIRGCMEMYGRSQERRWILGHLWEGLLTFWCQRIGELAEVAWI